DRAAEDDRCLPSYGMGTAGAAATAPCPAPTLTDPGHRRERLDAVLLGGVPAPHACLRQDRAGRDLRILDVTDAGDTRVGPSLGRHGPLLGRGARRRQV